MPETMERTSVEINDNALALAHGEDVAALKRNIVDAIGGGGGFVDLAIAGNRVASVLFTEHTAVTITTRTVDLREDGGGGALFESEEVDVDYLG